MDKKTRRIIWIGKAVCAVLVVAIVALQFVPYFYGAENNKTTDVITKEEYEELIAAEEFLSEEELSSTYYYGPIKMSIARFIWFPNGSLKNPIIFMPVLVLAFAFLTVFTYVRNTYSVMTCIWAILCPLVGLIGWLTVPLYQVGSHVINPWVWTASVALCGVTLVFALATGISWLTITLVNVRKNAKKLKAMHTHY